MGGLFAFSPPRCRLIFRLMSNVHLCWRRARANNPDPTYAQRFSITVYSICFCLVMELSDGCPPRVYRDGIGNSEGKNIL